MTLQSVDAGEAVDHPIGGGSIPSDHDAEPLADEGSLTFEAPVEGSALARTWKLMPRALHYLRGHRIKGVVLILVTGLGALVTLAEPWPLAFVIDTVLKDKPPPAWITNVVGTGTTALILFAVLAMLGIALLAGGTLVIERYLSTNINLRATLDFRSDVMRHLQRLSLAYHDDNRTGVMLFRINQQAPGVGAMLVALPDLAQSLLTVVGMAIVVFLINAHVAELALFVVPIIYYSTIYYANRIEPKLLRVRGMEAMNLTLVHESLSMFRVISAFGRESDHYQRFRRQGDATVATRVHVTVLQVIFQLAVNFVTSVGTAAVLGVGAYEVVQGKMSAGELVVVMFYIASVYQPLESLTIDLTTLQQNTISFEHCLQILDTPIDVVEKPDAIELNGIKGNITFDKVAFDYASRPEVLKEVSFQLRGGQALAIVGPTGAGKSTLASLMPRFYDTKHGQVLIDGVDVRDLTLESLRKQFTIVLQEPLLFEGTIADNILYGKPGATAEEMTSAAKAANAHDFIMQLPRQYDTTVGEGGTKISGGERQRICVARAFLRNAPILILDEPTSSIDSRTEGVILDALDRLAHGRTTVMIAHRLSTIRHADEILVLDGGAVVQQGTHDQLIAQDGLYRQLWEAQNGNGNGKGKASVVLRDAGQGSGATGRDA
jgi:ABC-type multidrug transport system fused ATPase/permease subunit